MYRTKIWDEDKWDIHFGSYNSSRYGNSFMGKKDEKKYHEQKYGAQEKDVSSDYARKEGREMEDKERKLHIFDDLKAENNQKQESTDEELPFKAAKLLFEKERRNERQATRKKDISTIEDAIKKAIEEEKKIIIVN